jgi:hypothetical protein
MILINTFIENLIKNHLEEITEKSLLNCHVDGLHSIMLLDHPEKTIRLYVAMPGNTLYKNTRFTTNLMSLSFHPHHCDLTLQVTRGHLTNWNVKESDTGTEFDKYIYHSQITEGRLGFEYVGKSFLETTKRILISEGGQEFLSADTIHTVACSTDRVTAWLVYEGKEDPNYIPYCWTNTDLLNQDHSKLYQKPTQADVLMLLNEAGLIR